MNIPVLKTIDQPKSTIITKNIKPDPKKFNFSAYEFYSNFLSIFFTVFSGMLIVKIKAIGFQILDVSL